MATTIKLEGEARSEFGKGVARRLRVANKIPATIYAGGEEPAFVTLPMAVAASRATCTSGLGFHAMLLTSSVQFGVSFTVELS